MRSLVNANIFFLAQLSLQSALNNSPSIFLGSSDPPNTYEAIYMKLLTTRRCIWILVPPRQDII